MQTADKITKIFEILAVIMGTMFASSSFIFLVRASFEPSKLCKNYFRKVKDEKTRKGKYALLKCMPLLCQYFLCLP